MDPKNRNRYVQLHTWYVSANGQRQFIVVDKAGKMMEEKQAGGGDLLIWRTTVVSLCEVLDPRPISHDIDRFWRLVDDGKLIEFLPGMSLKQIQEDYEEALRQFRPISAQQAA